MIEKHPSENMSTIAKRCDLSYQTVHSIVDGGNEPKEKTIMRLALGCKKSVAEIYANDDEIVVCDPWEKQFLLAYRKACMDARVCAMAELQKGMHDSS